MSFLGDEHHTFGYGRPLVVLKAGSNRWPNSLAMCRSSSWYHCILSPRWRRRSAITWAPNSPLGELYEGGKKMSRYIVSKSTIINITHTLQPQLETLEPMWNTSVRHINSIRKISTVDCSVSPITFVCMAQDTIIILQQYKYQPVHVVDYISSSIGQEDNKTLEVKSYPKTLMLVSNTDTTTSLSRRTSFTVFFTPSSNSSSLFKSCSK